MQKTNKQSFFKLSLFLLTIIMIIGLFTELLPQFAAHSSSMIIGTIAYVCLVALAWFSNDTSGSKIKFLTLAIASFTGFHIVSEMVIVQSLNFLLLTSVLGYAALGVLFLAMVVKLMNLINRGPVSSLALNGLMTSGTVLVYWHVSSIEAVQSSLIFFVPFTLLCLATFAQFIYQLLSVKRPSQVNA